MEFLILTIECLIFIAVVAVVAVVQKGVPTYVAEKSKNLATKQDIEEITRRIEHVKAEIVDLQAGRAAKRQLKYEACLDALSVVDAHFVQIFSGENPTPQLADTQKARECHNKLILSCDDVGIVEKWAEILFGPKQGEERRPPTELLNEFRNLIRQELGFGEALTLDSDRVWVGQALGDPKNPSPPAPDG
jgi:hypothetical protein